MMADSEDETYNNEDCVNLTGFLFGNIDESGKLESDVFDSESQKHLASLGKYVICIQYFNKCNKWAINF